MRILSKPWMNREDGRIMLVNHNKVIFSTHYRNLQHRDEIIAEMKQIIKGAK